MRPHRVVIRRADALCCRWFDPREWSGPEQKLRARRCQSASKLVSLAPGSILGAPVDKPGRWAHMRRLLSKRLSVRGEGRANAADAQLRDRPDELLMRSNDSRSGSHAGLLRDKLWRWWKSAKSHKLRVAL